MTESQAKTIAENLASVLHQLALVESRRAVEEYRARHEPDVQIDIEGLKQASVQARRDTESVLVKVLQEIKAESQKPREAAVSDPTAPGAVEPSYPWRKG
jgi:propanediol dehydratase large subunit